MLTFETITAEWDIVIGLEVHAQLKTCAKMFSASATTYGAPPNTQASAIDLALPGTLPTINLRAVQMAIQFGLAIGAKISPILCFSRKHYMYPDLPKGYQITQFDKPIVETGQLCLQEGESEKKVIRITRAHLEEDAGKSYHEDLAEYSGIDFNRAGVPLLEIVSEPDLTSPKEAVLYLKTLHNLLLYLDICDGNMQEGSFRSDVNVSLKPKGASQLGTRAEIKNVNSFKFVEKAIQFECIRQAQILQAGGVIEQETRTYDPATNMTYTLRSKENALDYRYIPEPDLLPLFISDEMLVQAEKTLPELPDAKYLRLRTAYQLSHYDVSNLVANPLITAFFEAVMARTAAAPKQVVNWIMVEWMALMNKQNLAVTANPISAENFALFLDRITDKTLSGKLAKLVLERMFLEGKDADSIIQAQGLVQVHDTALIRQTIAEVLAALPAQVKAYREGQVKLFGFFVGQVMKAMQGKADPQQVNQLLKEILCGSE